MCIHVYCTYDVDLFSSLLILSLSACSLCSLSLSPCSGSPNFALLADPYDPTLVYIAGTAQFVARVSLTDYSWSYLSDGISSSLPPATASHTGPHADGRHFWWDATNDDLLLTNDGGIYRRTAMKSADITTGDWLSVTGDLSTTEVYQAAYDHKTGQFRYSNTQRDITP